LTRSTFKNCAGIHFKGGLLRKREGGPLANRGFISWLRGEKEKVAKGGGGSRGDETFSRRGQNDESKFLQEARREYFRS